MTTVLPEGKLVELALAASHDVAGRHGQHATTFAVRTRFVDLCEEDSGTVGRPLASFCGSAAPQAVSDASAWTSNGAFQSVADDGAVDDGRASSVWELSLCCGSQREARPSACSRSCRHAAVCA